MSSARRRMDDVLAAARTDLAALVPGRADPRSLENVPVEAYGARQPLHTLAGIGVGGPRELVVTPYDATTAGAIERAIRLADPSLNPQGGSSNIRVPLPEPSEERRTDLARRAKARAEQARVAMRLVRQDALNDLKRAERAGTITAAKRGGRTKDIQRATDEVSRNLDALLAGTIGLILPG